MHGHIDDAQLLAELALSAREVYMPLIMLFMEEKNGDKAKRSFSEFVSEMVTELLRDAIDSSMEKLNRFSKPQTKKIR